MPSLRLSASAWTASVCCRSSPIATTSAYVWTAAPHRRGVKVDIARGRRALVVPQGVSFAVDESPGKPDVAYVHPLRRDRRILTVTGPHGSLPVEIPSFLRFEPPFETLGETTPGALKLFIDDERIVAKRMMYNTVNTHIGTAIEGVTRMHEAEINLVGVGYRVTRVNPPFVKKEDLPPWLEGVPPKKELPRLVFRVGFPDERIFDIPEGWETDIRSPTHVVIRAPDKMKLGNFCTAIRAHRKPEPYNGKGIFVNGETIKRKEPRRR